MNQISKSLCKVVVAILLSVSVFAHAQYTEKWQASSPGAYWYIGCENTDSDNNKEVICIGGLGGSNNYTITVVDGLTGTVEWQLYPGWYQITVSSDLTYPKLIDVDSDGRYEILFFGKVTQTDSSRWYLYEYSGSRVEEEQRQIDVYQKVTLGQNYPNPTTSITTIKYSLTQKEDVILKIYNSAGQLVRTLSEGLKEPGTCTINWDSRDDNGAKLPSGSYFYQLEIDNQKRSKKLVIVK